MLVRLSGALRRPVSPVHVLIAIAIGVYVNVVFLSPGLERYLAP